MQPDREAVHANVREIAAAFAAQRGERQQRRALDRADFDRLAQAGFLLTGVPARAGWPLGERARSRRGRSARLLRTLAGGDSSRRARVVDASGGARLLARIAARRGRRPGRLGPPARRGLRRRARRPLVGHDHLGAGQRRRHREDEDAREARWIRRLPALGPEALRQRLRHLELHDHHRRARGRNRARALLLRRAPRLGRLRRHEAHRRVGRTRHGGHAEPRVPVRWRAGRAMRLARRPAARACRHRSASSAASSPP